MVVLNNTEQLTLINFTKYKIFGHLRREEQRFEKYLRQIIMSYR